MFGTIMTVAVTVMHVYVFWRASSAPWLPCRFPRWALPALGAALWLVFYLGRRYGHGGTGDDARMLELIGMDWMAALFLICLSLLTVDLLTGFGLLLPRLAPTLRGLALAAGGILTLIAIIQGVRPPVIREYEVRLAALPDSLEGTVVIAMSDLHIGSLLDERWLKARVAQVREERPDLVVLLGDLSEGHGPSRRWPVRGVPGSFRSAGGLGGPRQPRVLWQAGRACPGQRRGGLPDAAQFFGRASSRPGAGRRGPLFLPPPPGSGR